VLQPGFLHLLVRAVGKICPPVRSRDRQHFGFAVHSAPHLLEQRVLEAIKNLRLTIIADTEMGEGEQPLGARHRQWPQQQCVDQPECRRARPERQP